MIHYFHPLHHTPRSAWLESAFLGPSVNRPLRAWNGVRSTFILYQSHL